MYISSCLFSFVSSGLLITPRCFLSVSLALSSPDVIKDYYLSLRPSLRVPVSSSSVHRDRRPDLNSKRRPFTSFCFPCLKSLLFWFLCLSVPRVATRPSALARVKSAWEFGGIAASAVSPLAASPHARRSREIFAAGCGYPKPAVWLSNSRVAAPPSSPFAGVHAAVSGSPSPPFAGDHAAVHGSPVRGRSRRRPPMTQARRPAADSSPPASR